MDANYLEYFFTICAVLSEQSITQTKPIQFTVTLSRHCKFR